MKRMQIFMIFMITLFAALAIPTTENTKADKPSQNEVLGNLGTENSATDLDKKTTSQPDVRISAGGNIGIHIPKEEDETKTQRPLFPAPPPPPSRNPLVFSKFIDDVFQIPITVLQSVSKLLTNPFTQRNKNKDTST